MATFLQQYIITALWASTDDNGEPLDGLYGPDDIAPTALEDMKGDCEAFLADNANDIGERVERAAHDFWLTRNHHGAGFWDGDWAEDVGKRLTAAAHAYGSCDLYVGDDGLVYCM